MCQPYGIFPWCTDSVSLLRKHLNPFLRVQMTVEEKNPASPFMNVPPGCREGNEEVGLGCSPLPGRGYLLPRELSPTEPCRRVAYSHPSGEGCRGRYSGLRTTS